MRLPQRGAIICTKRYLSVNVQQPPKAKKHYDVVIAGGGMVGTTLACTLGKNPLLQGRKILLLEASQSKQWSLPEKYSNRVSSLNPGTQRLFNDIDAWKHIAESRLGVVKKMQVWDALSDALITFNNDNMEEPVAYIVENDLILHAVNTELKKTEVEVLYGAKINEYVMPTNSEETVMIGLEGDKLFSCDLLLGCDGANSQVRKAMSAHYLSWDYNQRGIVATLKFSEGVENNVVAWQRFLPTGPIAILPLNDKLSSLVWSTTLEESKKLLQLPDEEFVGALNNALCMDFPRGLVVDQLSKAFDNVLKFFDGSSLTVRQLPPKIGGIEENSRAAFPLGFGHSSQYIRQGVALVGDAAHRIHPLAGQGVNLGFGDVVCLNKILGEAVRSGSKLDNMLYLKQYETERQAHNFPTMLAVEGLYRLYNTNFTPVVLLRSLGLQATNALPPLKKVLIAQAAV